MARQIGGRIPPIKKGDAANYEAAADCVDPFVVINNHLMGARKFLRDNPRRTQRELETALKLLETTPTLSAPQKTKLANEVHNILVDWLALETQKEKPRPQELQTIKKFTQRTGFDDIENAVDKVLNPDAREFKPAISFNEASQKKSVARDPQSPEEAIDMAAENLDIAQAFLMEARRQLKLGLLQAQRALDVDQCKIMRELLADIEMRINPTKPAANLPDSLRP